MNEILVFIGKIIMIPALIIANLFAPIPLINDVVYPPTEDIPVGAALPQATGVFETSLAAPISSTATSMTLTANAVRGGGVVAGYTCFTVDEGSAQAEIICGTVSTTSVTSMTRGISYSDGVTVVTANKFAHRRGANIKITDFPILQILKAQNNGDATFDAPISYKTGIGPIANSDLTDKEYVLSVVTGGTITTDKIIEAGTAGETVAAGNLVYYKTSDSRWWKSDADLIATVENIVLGIAQGSGTAGAAITGGVLLRGIDTNQTGLTANTVYYASNTAGALSSSAGTISVTIGFAPSTTTISFNPRFDKTGRASETAEGTVEEATDAEVTAGTATGGTGAKLFVTPAKLATRLPSISIATTQLTGVVPVANLPTPAFYQRVAVPGLTTEVMYASSSNTDGSVLITLVNTAGNALKRFARDANTGIYVQTHEVNPTLDGQYSSLTVLGNYVYLFNDSGNNIVSYRYLLDDLTGETLMTAPALDTSGTNYNVRSWTDGTFMYVAQTKASTVGNRWSLSGTTFSASATSTTAVSYNGLDQIMFDGTNIYQVTVASDTITIRKANDVYCAAFTTTTKQIATEINSYTGSIPLVIDSTRMYVGYQMIATDETATRKQIMVLTPVTKP